MHICIIYFSPAGTTRKVAYQFKDYFQEKDCTVQILDITKDATLFPQANYADFFQKVDPHDLLLVGGPVYIDHMQYHILDLLANLPFADQLKWGKYAGVFASFGKVDPGVALAESAKLLSKSGRNTIIGLEVDSSHCIARNLPTKISSELPNEQLLPLIRQSALHALKIIRNANIEEQDLTPRLQKVYDDYPNLRPEQEVVAASYPKVAINNKLCMQCMACVESCPVNYLAVKDGYPEISEVGNCIHCTNCLYNCPTGAILMDITQKEFFLQSKLKEKNIAPNGPSLSKIYLAQADK